MSWVCLRSTPAECLQSQIIVLKLLLIVSLSALNIQHICAPDKFVRSCLHVVESGPGATCRDGSTCLQGTLSSSCDAVLMMSAINTIDPNHQHDDVGVPVVIRGGEALLYSMKGAASYLTLWVQMWTKERSRVSPLNIKRFQIKICGLISFFNHFIY